MNLKHLLNIYSTCIEYVPCKIIEEQMNMIASLLKVYSKIHPHNKVLMKCDPSFQTKTKTNVNPSKLKEVSIKWATSFCLTLGTIL